MILYDKLARINFLHYGIMIPSLPTRAEKTIKTLLTHPTLGVSTENWLISESPNTIRKEDLLRVHTREYIDKIYGEELRSILERTYELVDEQGNYNRYSPEEAKAPLIGILDDVYKVISSTYYAIEVALKEGFCYNLAGGMHHAHPSFGHGFCLLNDIGIALLKAHQNGLFKMAWVVDVDAHRGDGTAEIMIDHPNITTLSIHMASGWPLDSPQYNEKGDLNPSWIPGDVDIPIESGDEDTYIPLLRENLQRLEKERGLPDLIFVVAGVDPYEKDELPSTTPLNLTKEQMLERDQMIYNFCKERELPSSWVYAGGYGKYSWEIHSAFLTWALLERREN